MHQKPSEKSGEMAHQTVLKGDDTLDLSYANNTLFLTPYKQRPFARVTEHYICTYRTYEKKQ